MVILNRLCFLGFIMFFCFAQMYSQYKISGKLKDLQTDKSIPYVNISVPELGIGTVSNSYGYFELELDNRSRRVVLSSIAYETEEARASDLAFGKIIHLVPKAYDLPEVYIAAPKITSDLEILGLRNKKRGHSVGFGSRQLGTEIGSVIDIRDSFLIESAHFVLNHAKGDSLIFRLNLYDYRDGKPGEKLIKKDVFVRSKQKTGEISVDLKSFGLVVDAPVLIALEWIRDDDGSGNEGISFDTRRGKKHKGIYLKDFSGGAFKRLGHKRKLSMCFFLKAYAI